MRNELDELLINGNLKYQQNIYDRTELFQPDLKFPKYPTVILTCMDPRIDVYRIFQLKPGDVFVLKNAGNIYTEDVLRSVLVAIHKYNIQFIVVLGHLDCGTKNLHIGNLLDKLTDLTVKRIGRSGTNFYLELKKFFKTFTDEIKNVENQVQKFKNMREFPADIKITGMLYDPDTGWVFGDEELKLYSNYESFIKNYRNLLQNKKLEMVDYIEENETEIIGGEKYQEHKILGTNETLEQMQKEATVNDFLDINNAKVINKLQESSKETEQTIAGDFNTNLISIQRVKIPKINVPKINIYIPKFYKKNSEK